MTEKRCLTMTARVRYYVRGIADMRRCIGLNCTSGLGIFQGISVEMARDLLLLTPHLTCADDDIRTGRIEVATLLSVHAI